MGTDVHAIAQRKTASGWEDVPHKWSEDRHYKLFAWIGNVRNGFGFAGIPTHAPITPLSDNRGYPQGFQVEDDMHRITANELRGERRAEWYVKEDADVECAERLLVWMGDHSHSWLLWKEIVEAPSPLTSCISTGIITAELLKSWDRQSPPKEWCGGVDGYGINVALDIDEFDPKIHSHCRVQWNSANDEFDYFINETKRLLVEYGEGRFVFGFDS